MSNPQVEICEDLLRKAKTVSVLITLYLKGESSIHLLHRAVGGSLETLYQTLDLLQIKNLVARRRVKRRVFVSLTDLGRRVAEHLDKIAELVANPKHYYGG